MGFAPLSGPFWVFFVYIEPLLTYAGAYRAIFDSRNFAQELLPARKGFALTAVSAATPTAVAAVRQLGNCYFLIACMSFFVLPRIAALSKYNANAVHDVLKAYFGVLAVLDITHIVCTMIDLGTASPLEYNALQHGSTSLVVGLFVWRMAWFASTSSARRKQKAKA